MAVRDFPEKKVYIYTMSVNSIMQKRLFVLGMLLLMLSFIKCASAQEPVILQVSESTFVTGAYVVWETDVPSGSRVDYGPASSYGLSIRDDTAVTHHVLTVTGLSPGTTYHYRVTSGSAVSEDRTFTTYAHPAGTVKTVGSSGKDYPTVQGCVSSASPGWTCLVYSGSYSVATPNSGNAGGGYVTVLAQEAASISGFNTAGKSYIAIKGMEITGNGVGSKGASEHVLVENNYIHSTGGNCISPRDSSVSDWWIIRKNIIYGCGYTGIDISGNNILIEDNDISHQANDCIYGGMTNSVIRDNVCHDYDPEGSGQHLDFWQWDGSSVEAASYSLVENNRVFRCTDSTHNCHVVILRNPGGSPASSDVISRYNFAQDVDGGGFIYGSGSTDSIRDGRIYSNTLALEYSPVSCGDADGQFDTTYHGPNTKTLNNLAYNTCYYQCSPFGTDTGVVNNYNVARDSAHTTASWGSAYQAEETYQSLRNLDPSFTDYPYKPDISSGSPLVDAGGELTEVAQGDSGSGTTLIVDDARWFQPGWAGTGADWIAVGTVDDIVQISSIDYDTNTIILANPINRIDGDPVWLYKDSSGRRVLYGSAPDIGAYEYKAEEGTSYHYVREGATGSGSGADWANAFTSLPSIMKRGDTYYVADGSYGSYTFDDANSGSEYITIKKATGPDHGTSVGWSNSYGDGQAVFGPFNFFTDYYIIEGSKRNEDDWKDSSAYGFVFKGPSGYGYKIFRFGDDLTVANNIRINHVYAYFPDVCYQSECYLNGILYAPYGSDNIYLGNSLLVNLSNHAAIRVGNGRNYLVENNYFYNIYRKELISDQSGTRNFTFRNNIMENVAGTAAIASDSGSDWQIYNNVFFSPDDRYTFTDGIITTWTGKGQSTTNFKIFGNTFYQMRGALRIGSDGGTGNEVRNNLYIGFTPSYATYAHSDNIDDADPGIVVSADEGNFHLSQATEEGYHLSAPYNTDLEGHQRGRDSNWDIGAYEYTTGQVCNAADSDTNGIISNRELLAYISLWKTAGVSMQDMIEAIREWKNGCQ